ncbi:MAG: hypothetical protein ABW007_19060 [Chitinophagaceae bacterium]
MSDETMPQSCSSLAEQYKPNPPAFSLDSTEDFEKVLPDLNNVVSEEWNDLETLNKNPPKPHPKQGPIKHYTFKVN